MFSLLDHESLHRGWRTKARSQSSRHNLKAMKIKAFWILLFAQSTLANPTQEESHEPVEQPEMPDLESIDQHTRAKMPNHIEFDDYEFPLDKLKTTTTDNSKIPLVLVACGSCIYIS